MMTLREGEKSRLRNRYGSWAVVTGASSGIGQELAEQLADAGLNLLISARRADRLEQVAQRLRADYGVEVRSVPADMAELADRQRLLEATDQVDVGLLVASAGYGTSGLLVTSDLDTELNLIGVNCGAVLHLTHHFARRFAQNRRGGIILLSSMVGFQGVPYAANYAATKAYVQSLAEALARELKPNGVDVLAAAPGPVTSGFGQRAGMTMNMAMKPSQVGVPILRALGRQTTVLPGFLTKMLVYSLRTVPRWGKIRIMEQVMGGMTAAHR
ncbi:SDR family NAD(P)-dependent oxidoreductase [Larkinella sp. VNQ87]|uniref:SDR family NAD(P)-dependent oxidoreductase n=1 Tax=Larkinella sp. VNQ87 TaxID=3400921 RepID=UPI003C11F511